MRFWGGAVEGVGLGRILRGSLVVGMDCVRGSRADCAWEDKNGFEPVIILWWRYPSRLWRKARDGVGTSWIRGLLLGVDDETMIISQRA